MNYLDSPRDKKPAMSSITYNRLRISPLIFYGFKEKCQLSLPENVRICVLTDVDGTLLPRARTLLFGLTDRLVSSGLYSSSYYRKMQKVRQAYKSDKLSPDETVITASDVLSEGLKGKRVDDVRNISDNLIENIELYESVRKSFSFYQKLNIDSFLISGSPDFMIENLANSLYSTGFEATDIPIEFLNGEYVFSGKKPSRYITSDTKKAIFERIKQSKKYQIILGSGDSSGDYGFLSQVDFSVLLNSDFSDVMRFTPPRNCLIVDTHKFCDVSMHILERIAERYGKLEIIKREKVYFPPDQLKQDHKKIGANEEAIEQFISNYRQIMANMDINPEKAKAQLNDIDSIYIRSNISDFVTGDSSNVFRQFLNKLDLISSEQKN